VSDWARFKTALVDAPLPIALLDLDALERNADVLAAAMEHSAARLRMATKSLRVPWVMRWLEERFAARSCGWMSFSVHESALLVDQGFDGFLVAYPVSRQADAEAFATLTSAGKTVAAMVDEPEQVRLLAEAGRALGTSIPCCIDVDASWRPGGGLHLGVRRSPIRGPEAAVELARFIADQGGVHFQGIMAYEAQVAGLPDRIPGDNLLAPARRFIKARSRVAVADLRRRVVRALTEAGLPPAWVNGGGTGSIHSTPFDESCTEITVGSGFYTPHTFDGYDGLALEPAAFFALPVVRRPDPGILTCAGGGYVASGSVGPTRWPQVYLPSGLAPLDMEGWGEVQTPLAIGSGAPAIALGDPIICRHAKAGELMERFATVALLRGDRIVDEVPTLRGLGGSFF